MKIGLNWEFMFWLFMVIWFVRSIAPLFRTPPAWTVFWAVVLGLVPLAAVICIGWPYFGSPFRG